MIARPARDALSSATKKPFRFRGCLAARRELYHTTTAHAADVAILPATHDDKALVSVFDTPRSNQKMSGFTTTGLFNHAMLTHPRSLNTIAQGTLIRAHILTNRILRARESRDELFKVVKNLDRLSDMLCSVIDLCELVRNSHPDRAWVEAANDAYEGLCQTMNELNTHVGLYDVLKVVLSDPEIVKSMTPEAYRTAMIFWNDFEKSAIDLPAKEREEFVALSSEIISLGRAFLEETNAARPPARITPSDLAGLKDKGMGVRLQLQAQFTQRDLHVYPGSLQAQMIMRSAPAEEPRRRVYIASHSSTEEQIALLERMLSTRAKLARLVGRESYAAMSLDDKMAKNPAWDRDYYCPPEPPAPPIPLPRLTFGTVLMGLSRLFRHLYGINLRPVKPLSGEVWHPDVHKLEVMDEEKGVIGHIYADVFARRGKASGAAHYTVRCSRRTDDDDAKGDVDDLTQRYGDLIKESEDFEAVGRQSMPGLPGTYQLPLVVLMCEFPRPSLGAAVLEWHEVMTLFHEMGHAMHSMIGRTEYQNVSGTRCPTDFVELPSILMEHFLNSREVLSLFIADSTSTTDLPIGHQHEDPCHSIDTYAQIMLAALDQIYHSPAALAPGFDSTRELARLHDRKGLIPYVPGTSFQTQFGHLFGYGATYYSYLFDRAIASRVWKDVFSASPLSRETGERYKQEVLRYGGGKDPWEMVSALLQAPELASGDAEAMAAVGRWKIEDEVGLPGRH
ncbi:mitochondrial intermediate peptidase mitochondrial precursor [Schizophyllum amplum]|uniref:Mitochondrial intermediate peptidase n=1 Tax=Schizophyllum amplum TaxID=97359 RepID=A0A550CMS7_9AGAR|nr:mitochondrial intermediate peptidase mitochondrial precursor [Auriculariopsis ampla]